MVNSVLHFGMYQGVIIFVSDKGHYSLRAKDKQTERSQKNTERPKYVKEASGGKMHERSLTLRCNDTH